MIIPRRAVLFLLLLLLAAGPATSVAQVTADPAPSTAAESLRTLQMENDSLRATLEQSASPAPARTGNSASSLALRLFEAIGVLVLAYFLGHGIGYVIEARAEQRPRRRLFLKRLLLILRILLWGAALAFVLRGIFDLTAEAFLIAVALVGIIMGLAAQNLLKNFFGGLVIAFDPPFQVGDRITVGETYGEVTAIGPCVTRITTPNDTLVSVPNAQMVDRPVANANAGAPNCQVVTDLYLPSGVDEVKAKKIAYEAAASSTYVSLQEPIVVHMRDMFKGTFLTHLQVKAYVLDARYEARLVTDITERARRVFREQGLLPVYDGRPRTALTPRPHAEENGPPSFDRLSSSPHSAGASE